MIFNIPLALSCLALSIYQTAQACQFHDLEAAASTPRKIAIKNVRVFDGYTLRPSGTVIINGAVIGDEGDECGAEIIDGQNGTLMPGLIDIHAHPANISHLETLSQFGVTTVVVEACFVPAACRSLQNHTGLTDVILGSTPAAAPNSVHGNITAAVLGANTTLLVHNASQAVSWVDEQVAWGPAFIKLIAETPGLDQQTLSALVLAAQAREMRTVCHINAFGAMQQAIAARNEQIHHAPLDKPPTAEMVSQMAIQNQISVPTLTIMKAIASSSGHTITPGTNFSVALETVRRFHEAHIPVLAGSDANQQPGLVAMVPFGSSLHGELQLLVDAGLEPVQALRAATSRAAHYWDLRDRGVIAPGKRADLVLVHGDPTVDISATRNLARVWLGGVEWTQGLGTF
ncbi:putative hydrolase [Microdochium trichocladiopsis]|uniref:Hydrolase n=1 Tax=Microdochium trichocladiopsis TaxID=1682393 RepID=A0A9P8XTT7_9PEZI|nr:putative hydrolase [Microdochium trichocladiopsis]KAH7014224.1 putative hydrolase [Microdochium trichocladiopsis]